MTATISVTEQIAAFQTSRRAGVEFLLRAIHPDGSIEDGRRPRFNFYRVPWALAVSGETEAAARVLDWIERDCLGEDGRIHGGVDWDATANQTTNTYPETIVAYGAMLLRRFDIARKTMSFARNFLDPETGGIFMTREENGPDGRQLLFPTCQFGMSAVLSGDLEGARAVGRWLGNLWKSQPELPDKLYTIWTSDRGLATDVPASPMRLHYLNDARDAHQLHYNGGIAAACLTHIFMATGEARWLELARKFQRFSMESTPAQFTVKQVCKSAWGSGLISMAARDDSYLPWLLKMGDWFAAGQDSDGGWSNTAHLDPNPPLAHRIEVVAEFVVHMDTLIAAVSAIDARQRV